MTYLGEFMVDGDMPYYMTDAPESADRPAERHSRDPHSARPTRQVIVFRLLPVGAVLHDIQDAFEPPSGIRTATIETATSGSASTPITDKVPIEALNNETFIVNPSQQQHEVERREQRLLLDYVTHLEREGCDVSRRRILPPR